MTITLMKFAEMVKDRIGEYLPEEYSDIEIRKVLKNNGTELIGITVRKPDSAVSPTIYLENSYEMYKDGTPLDVILNKLTKVVKENSGQIDFDAKQLVAWDFCIDKVLPKLVNTEMNRELLKDCPHRELEDLSIIYQIKIHSDDFGTGNVTINNQIISNWHVTEEDLHDIAIRNLENRGVTTLKSLGGMISELLADNEGMDFSSEEVTGGMEMYVLTNKERFCGANEVLNIRQMQEISKLFRSGYYCLPSSIHEWIIVPKDSRYEVKADELRDLVTSVNTTSVGHEDILSNNIYEYTDKGLQIAC